MNVHACHTIFDSNTEPIVTDPGQRHHSNDVSKHTIADTGFRQQNQMINRLERETAAWEACKPLHQTWTFAIDTSIAGNARRAAPYAARSNGQRADDEWPDRSSARVRHWERQYQFGENTKNDSFSMSNGDQVYRFSTDYFATANAAAKQRISNAVLEGLYRRCQPAKKN